MPTSSIKRSVNEYGFDSLEIRAESGGHKVIDFYGGFSDIGHITSSNGVGIGIADYIRDKDDISRHISSAEQTVWLTDEERGALINFLMEIWKRTDDFIKVKNRFNVDKTFSSGKTVYTFTEKDEDVITLHTTVAITISIPNSWTESSAWRALLDVLNPNARSYKDRFEKKSS